LYEEKKNIFFYLHDKNKKKFNVMSEFWTLLMGRILGATLKVR